MSNPEPNLDAREPPPNADGYVEPLLAIRDLKVHFDLAGESAWARFSGKGGARVVKAVDGVSIDIYPGETLGLVGESVAHDE